jgi:hypothetical protein
LSAFGADPAVVAAEVEQETEAMLFAVHPDNEILLAVFLALQTQWRIAVGAARAVYLGIDYGSIPPVLSMLGIPRRERADAFAAVLLMEAAALPILNAPRPETDG